MKAYSVGNNREDNGNYTASYYFRYDELRTIIQALEELHNYEYQWSTDDRPSVAKWAQEQMDMITELSNKVEYYRHYALELREEE